MKRSGSKTRLTLRGATTLTITNVFLSRAIGATGSDRWQPGADRKQVSGTFVMAPDTPHTLPDTAYALTNVEDLLVAFDIASGIGRRLTTNIGTSIGFVKGGTATAPAQEAGITPRTTSGWATNNALFLIEKIDVLIT